MSITVELSGQELAMIRELTRIGNDAEAVVKAAREFVRISQLRELKAASGKVEFDDASEQLEARELTEQQYPSHGQ
ncbi:MAG TPA: hypothetical protein VFE46_08895 [Pirellulales bacterium]|jgi:hypothetical protein|nr:hypothetical protein [Pirellulales bacterium]